MLNPENKPANLHYMPVPIFPNTRYIKDFPGEESGDKNGLLASSYAMMWCLAATGFNRIFTKDDMGEFIFRLAISLNSMGIIKNWLMHDEILQFYLEGEQYLISLDDIKLHFGFEIIDSSVNNVPRVNYL